jgi:leucyl aminopeptidase
MAAGLVAVLLTVQSSPAAASPVPRLDAPVWITLGADAFASAKVDGAPLPRIDEAAGVVLTHVPSAAIPGLAEILHRELRRCGSFVAHGSLTEARAALERVRWPRRPEGDLPFTIDQPAWVGQLFTAIEESELLATLTALSTSFPNRYHAHHATHHSADWIRDLWAGYAAARPEVTVALFDHGSLTPQPSVIVTIPGTTLADEVVVLGAHQDSIATGCSGAPGCDAPGADDDGSGIAALSELIRAALTEGFRPQRTVQFMAYAAEEVGLRGSDDLAATYLAAGTNVVAVLQLDMTGYFGSTEDVVFIADHTDDLLTLFVADLVDTYLPELVWTSDTCGYACSDHASWNSRGFRAAFPFEARFGEHNAALHSSADTVGTLGVGAAHAIKFARLAAAFLAETALEQPTPIFSDGFESGDTRAWSQAVP